MNWASWRAALQRKGNAALKQIPRSIERARSKPIDYTIRPPIIVNSLPKSGTHLLMQIARALPETQYYGTFVASRASYATRLRSQKEIDARLRRIVPGEVVGAHLFYSEHTIKTLSELNALHLFIYRDPRAVIVSEVQYLVAMAPWNILHKRFADLPTLQAQIDLAIHGDSTPELPRAVHRYAPFLSWRNDPSTLVIRYEDLIDPDGLGLVIRDIIRNYSHLTPKALGTNSDFEKLKKSISPRDSHTFSGSDPNRWRKILTPSQLEILEKDFPWI